MTNKYKTRLLILIASVLLLISSAYFFLTNTQLAQNHNWLNPDYAINGIVIAILLTLFFSWLLLRELLKIESGGSRLYKYIMINFAGISLIPSISVMTFFFYFFSGNLQSWFDSKISNILDKSSYIAESYINEHVLQMKQTAFYVSEDISQIFYQIINNRALFNEILSKQAYLRSIDEAIIFDKLSKSIIAQTHFSFSLSFINLPDGAIETADKGEIVEIKSNPTKIRILVKIRNQENVYLLIGRLIDKEIINHIYDVEGTIGQYLNFKKKNNLLQLKVGTIYIFLSLIILICAISVANIVAARILHRLKSLILTTKLVKEGNLEAKVEEDNNNDEISILNSAFNDMTKQLNLQRKDLIIAQRALAWSDIARKIAHEIKNPLTPMQLCTEMVLKKFKPEVSDAKKFENYLLTILKHCEDIRRIVDEFVNFARFPNPVFEKCDIVKIIKDIIRSRSILFPDVKYMFHHEKENIDFVCDKNQINQIMVNILKNAEEAMRENNFKNQMIEIKIQTENQYIKIKVEDRGPGFDKHALDNATEAYFTTRPKGTGLGLAIVKKIVQDHCGEIIISNNQNKNSELIGGVVEIKFNTDKLNQKFYEN